MFQQAFLDHPRGAGDGRRANALPAAPAGRLIGSVGSWAVHPALLAAHPIRALFAQNAREVRPAELTALLGGALLGSLAVWLLFALLLRDGRKAGLIASLAVVLFFTVDRALEPVQRLVRHLY